MQEPKKKILVKLSFKNKSKDKVWKAVNGCAERNKHPHGR